MQTPQLDFFNLVSIQVRSSAPLASIALQDKPHAQYAMQGRVVHPSLRHRSPAQRTRFRRLEFQHVPHASLDIIARIQLRRFKSHALTVTIRTLLQALA